MANTWFSSITNARYYQLSTLPISTSRDLAKGTYPHMIELYFRISQIWISLKLLMKNCNRHTCFIVRHPSLQISSVFNKNCFLTMSSKLSSSCTSYRIIIKIPTNGTSQICDIVGKTIMVNWLKVKETVFSWIHSLASTYKYTKIFLALLISSLQIRKQK